MNTEDPMNPVRRFWTRLESRWLRRRHQVLTATRLHELDARALKDLGIDRSEIGSVAAESIGLVGRERLQSFQSFP
jgi:uncharacterized protein YjiS (DUF1127 family)